MKKFAGDIIILHVYQKSQSYDVWFLTQSETDFFVILGHFLPFHGPPNRPENQKFGKKF